jgi:hypothetical protein
VIDLGRRNDAPENCINVQKMPPVSTLLRRFRAAALVAASCVSYAACASTSYDAPNTLGVLPPQKPAPLWLGAVRGTDGAVNAGAAAVTPSQIPGWTHVLISLEDRAAGGIYTWSLRSGSCAAQGAVVGPADRYGEFAIHADGSGAADALVPATLSPSDSYAVVATPAAPGANAPGAASACADLSRGFM